MLVKFFLLLLLIVLYLLLQVIATLFKLLDMLHYAILTIVDSRIRFLDHVEHFLSQIWN